MGIDPADVAGRMAEQITALRAVDNHMNRNNLATLRDDVPPGAEREAVITPELYRQELLNGDISPDNRLLAKAHDALVEFCGPGNKVELNTDFTCKAGPALDDKMELAALFNMERSV